MEAIEKIMEKVVLPHGCYLQTSADMIAEQAGWNEYDAAKNSDFSSAPYWLTTDSGDGPFPIVNADDLEEYLDTPGLMR